MKTTLLTLCLVALATLAGAQPMRYFEVGLRLDAGADWRDTSFIVATNDPATLQAVEQELAKPVDERLSHVSGTLAGGNGGFNHNAGFWFRWHILPNSWSLVDLSVEVCDGRPYSDVEQDTAYWIGNIGYYCPWSSYILREVEAPVGVQNPIDEAALAFRVTPNPAVAEAVFSWQMIQPAPVALTITDLQGRLSLTMYLGPQGAGECSKTLSTSALDNGVYAAVLEVQGRQFSRSFVVQH